MNANKVIQLDGWRNRDTAALLRTLAARLDAGDLHGVLLQTINGQGQEHSYVTGAYARDHKVAVSAGLRLSVKHTLAQGGFDEEE